MSSSHAPTTDTEPRERISLGPLPPISAQLTLPGTINTESEVSDTETAASLSPSPERHSEMILPSSGGVTNIQRSRTNRDTVLTRSTSIGTMARKKRPHSSLSTKLFGSERKKQVNQGDKPCLPSVSRAVDVDDDGPTEKVRPSFARLMNASRANGSTNRKDQAILEGRYAEHSLFFIKGVISPNSAGKRVWNTILFLAVLYNTLLLPFYCSFAIIFTINPPSFQMTLSYVCDILWIADMVLNFYTGFFEEGLLVTERRRIRQKYMKSWFAVDVCAAIPLDLIAIGLGVAWLPFMRLNKMLQFYRTDIYTKEIERALRLNANVASLVRLLVMFAVFVHWAGCIFYFIGALEKESGEAYVWQDKAELWSANTFDKWLTSVYWSLTCMTTVGFGDIHPVTSTEMQYVIFVELLGVSVYATAFGNMTAMIQNMDVTATQFRRKVDTVTEYMKYRRLNPSLKKRILSYYDVVWSRHRGIDENSILNDLPTSLRAEVSLTLNREAIMSVPLFKTCTDPGFINSLVVMLVPVTALPGDYIVRYGEIGREMYFVRRGQANIMSKDGQTLFAQVKDGMYFGEVALLEDVRRTASVRAATYCDLLVLTKEDFERVVAFYPQYDAKIRHTAAEISANWTYPRSREEL